MPLYEACFVMRQDLSQQDVGKITDELAKVVEAHDGRVLYRESWGLRTLAYVVRKNRKGHYVMLVLNTPPAALKELERLMRISEDVIRHLFIKIDSYKKGPSIMLSMQEQRNHGDGDSPHPARRYGRPPHREAEESSEPAVEAAS